MIFILLPGDKIYYGGRPEEILNGADRAAKLNEDLRLKDLSPEQRKMVLEYRNSLSQQKNSAVEKKLQIEVKKTRKKAVIAGKPTQKFQVWVQGKLKEDLWIYEKIKLNAEIDLKKYVELMEAMSGPGNAKFYESSPEYMNLLEHGYSLKTIKYEEEGSRTTEVIQIEQKTIPDSEFQIPADYQRVDIEKMWMDEMEMNTE
jgi:hypothetical protein